MREPADRTAPGGKHNLAAQRILAQGAQQQAAVVQAAEMSLRLAGNPYKASTEPTYGHRFDTRRNATDVVSDGLNFYNR